MKWTRLPSKPPVIIESLGEPKIDEYGRYYFLKPQAKSKEGAVETAENNTNIAKKL